MRTYREFALDMLWARDKLAEAEGFKDSGKRRRKKKKKFLSDREAKIQKLKNNPQHWSGLV
jgi:hypothetical protein|tara:strand:+ start:827 stop:1009 length:183 start_codon:yes stop_codon:yes gene_type:complete